MTITDEPITDESITRTDLAEDIFVYLHASAKPMKLAVLGVRRTWFGSSTQLARGAGVEGERHPAIVAAVERLAADGRIDILRTNGGQLVFVVET